jgi:hypothetical protein
MPTYQTGICKRIRLFLCFVFCGGREWELVQISCPLEGGGYRFKVVSIGDFAVAVFTEDNQGRDLESEFKWVHLKRK